MKDTESNVRICVAWTWARLAFVRVEDAFASDSDDSVPHLAAEKPDQHGFEDGDYAVTLTVVRGRVLTMLRDFLSNLASRQTFGQGCLSS